MTNHQSDESELQGCFTHDLFNPLDKCLDKNPYCASHITFESDCIRDGVLGSSDKGLIIDHQATAMNTLTPPPGIETKFSNPRHSITAEEKPVMDAATGKKRKRASAKSPNEDSDDFKVQLLSILESSSRALSAHVESHSINRQLDRNQKKEHSESLMNALGKLTDALVKIAERL